MLKKKCEYTLNTFKWKYTGSNKNAGQSRRFYSTDQPPCHSSSISIIECDLDAIAKNIVGE